MAHPWREGIAYRLPLRINSLTLNCPNRVDRAGSVRSVPALDGLGSEKSGSSAVAQRVLIGGQLHAAHRRFEQGATDAWGAFRVVVDGLGPAWSSQTRWLQLFYLVYLTKMRRNSSACRRPTY